MDILVVLEDSSGKIHRLGLEAIVAAQSLANSQKLSVSSLVIGMNADDLSSEASQYNMDRVLKVKNDLVSLRHVFSQFILVHKNRTPSSTAYYHGGI